MAEKVKGDDECAICLGRMAKVRRDQHCCSECMSSYRGDVHPVTQRVLRKCICGLVWNNFCLLNQSSANHRPDLATFKIAQDADNADRLASQLKRVL